MDVSSGTKDKFIHGVDRYNNYTTNYTIIQIHSESIILGF